VKLSLGKSKNTKFCLLQIGESRTYISRGDLWKAELSAHSPRSDPPRTATRSGQTQYGLQ
jgi:hypothetical protein